MKVSLPYGRGAVTVEVPDDAVVLRPREAVPLDDPECAVREALARPLGSRPLEDVARGGRRAVVVISDITRPVPNQHPLPGILETLERAGLRRRDVTVLIGTGLHRPATEREIEELAGPEIAAVCPVLSHDARDATALVPAARDANGEPVLLHRAYVEADVRILTGFVEPHLFAGFSGGGKAVLPSIADAPSIMRNHCARNLAHPQATWCVGEGNPVFEEMRDVALQTGPSLNVTLDEVRRVTGVFAGQLVAAHNEAIRQAEHQALCPVLHEFDIVVVTNMGYPADLNLYQSVKGLSVAARAVRRGGTVILVAECAEGLGSAEYVALLRSERSPQAILDRILAPDFSVIDQWQVQIQATVQAKATVYLYSSLAPDTVRLAHLEPCTDIGATIASEVAQVEHAEGRAARVLVLPHGQLTVPTVN
jgi:nickel-dependent lactate racemase